MAQTQNIYFVYLCLKLFNSTSNSPIVNFPFICNNIPAAPTYVLYISQLIRYFRACSSNHDVLDRMLLLTRELLSQCFLLVKLKSSLQKFYGRHHDLVDRYGISVSQMTTDMLQLSHTLPCPFIIHDLSVLFQYTDSDYSFGIIKLLSQLTTHQSTQHLLFSYC